MGQNEGARQTDEAKVCSILPDWCRVKLGPMTITVPFTIVAPLDLSVRVASNVYFKKKKAFTMESRITKVVGDTGLGIFSGCSEGYCRPVTAAQKVRARKSFVVHHTSKFHMNSATENGTPNTIGKLVYIKVKGVEAKQEISEQDVKEARALMKKALKRNRGWWDHKRVTAEFEKGVADLAKEFGVEPNDLMAVFSVETCGTFSPSIPNPFNGASGLIQFTGTTAASLLNYPATAAGRAAALAALRAMTNTDQLAVVRSYLLPHKSGITGHGVDELYMTVFTGQPRTALAGTDTLYSQGSTAYTQNIQYDLNKDGNITKDEALDGVRKRLKKQKEKEERYNRIEAGLKISGF